MFDQPTKVQANNTVPYSKMNFENIINGLIKQIIINFSKEKVKLWLKEYKIRNK